MSATDIKHIISVFQTYHKNWFSDRMYFFLLIVFLLVLAIVWKKWHQNDISKIPGPLALPIIGTTFKMLGTPEHTWNFLQACNKKYYPIYKLSNPFLSVVHLLDPDDIEIVLSSKNHLRKGLIYNLLEAWLGKGLLTSAGSKWQYRRKLLTPAFHFNILQQFLHVFVEHGELLVKQLQLECDKPFTEITPIITQFTLHTICETAMGTKLNESTKENSDFVTATYRIGSIFLQRIARPWLFFDTFYKASKLYQQETATLKTLHHFTRSVIETRKATFKEPDAVELDVNEGGFAPKKRLAMLDLLLSLRSRGADISDEGIREEVDTFMFEGHDTTASGVSFALFLLANNPDVQEKVADEIYSVMGESHAQFSYGDIQQLRYLELVIKECLRHYPSVPIIGRRTDNEIHTSSGYTIPGNTIISIHIHALHHNPKFFPDPEKFDPERFLPENCQGRHPFAYLPFSAGSRNCIGQRFAMLELKTAIASIIRNFVLTPVDTPSSIQLFSNLIVKASNGIRIKFKKRGHQ